MRYHLPGGPTGLLRIMHEQFIKRFRLEEQTALWNKGLGEDDIIRGLARASQESEEAVAGWLVESSSGGTIARAADFWAMTRWHRAFPHYYPVVENKMEAPYSAEGRVAASCLTKLMKARVDPSYIATGLSQRFSWQQLIYGAENNVPLEYLGALIPGHDGADDDAVDA